MPRRLRSLTQCLALLRLHVDLLRVVQDDVHVLVKALQFGGGRTLGSDARESDTHDAPEPAPLTMICASMRVCFCSYSQTATRAFCKEEEGEARCGGSAAAACPWQSRVCDAGISLAEYIQCCAVLSATPLLCRLKGHTTTPAMHEATPLSTPPHTITQDSVSLSSARTQMPAGAHRAAHGCENDRRAAQGPLQRPFSRSRSQGHTLRGQCQNQRPLSRPLSKKVILKATLHTATLHTATFHKATLHCHSHKPLQMAPLLRPFFTATLQGHS